MHNLHRPSTIIPAEYDFVLHYSASGGLGGYFRVNCEREILGYAIDPTLKEVGHNATPIYGKHNPNGLCCIDGLKHIAKVRFSDRGGVHNCSVCGARFNEGEIWRHAPTEEHIYVGHICARKYGLLADRSAFELEKGRIEAARAAQIKREQTVEARKQFLLENPGLEEALATDHPIVRNIAQRFVSQLSPKQVSLVLKLAEETRNPKPTETRVAAPTGKQTFTGMVVSVKEQDTLTYGIIMRVTIKVVTPDGVWLAWGTRPTTLAAAAYAHNDCSLVGAEVEITATLKPGRELGFALMSRPRGRVITFACGGPGRCRVCTTPIEQSAQEER